MAKLRTVATMLPPRADLFRHYAEGAHHRFRNLCQALLVRYGFDHIYLDTHEDMKPRVFGPLRGCVVGLCRYFVACQGVRKLCCGRAPTGDDTVEVDQKRLHCCGRQWC